jgi:hypothetical protein
MERSAAHFTSFCVVHIAQRSAQRGSEVSERVARWQNLRNQKNFNASGEPAMGIIFSRKVS